MGKNVLQEFFQEKKQKAKPADADWAAKRDAWVGAVKALYRTIIDDYLKAAKEDVGISQSDKVVTESFIGEYHVPDLILRVGEEQVIFSPKGAMVVGAQAESTFKGNSEMRPSSGKGAIAGTWSPRGRRRSALCP